MVSDSDLSPCEYGVSTVGVRARERSRACSQPYREQVSESERKRSVRESGQLPYTQSVRGLSLKAQSVHVFGSETGACRFKMADSGGTLLLRSLGAAFREVLRKDFDKELLEE